MSHECYMNVTFRFCFRSPLKSLKLPVFKGLSTDLGSHSFLHISFYPLYHIAGWGYDDTEDENLIKVDQDVPEEKSERILFKGDGTYKWYWYLGSYGWQSSNYIHKYEVFGNKIILYASNGDISDTYHVVSIKGDVVVLEVTLDEGPQYKQQITCKRVN